MTSETISLEDAARLEGANYNSLKSRLRRAHILLRPDESDARRRVARVSELLERGILSQKGYQVWLREQIEEGFRQGPEPRTPNPETRIPPARVAGAHGNLPEANSIDLNSAPRPDLALAPSNPPPRKSQPLLPFAHPTPAQAALSAVPIKYRGYIDKWLGVFAEGMNGKWKLGEGYIVNGCTIESRSDWLKYVIVPQYGISETDFYRKQQILKLILKDRSIPDDRKIAEFAKRIIPRPRPGRQGAAFFAQPENFWQLAFLRKVYLNQARLSVKAAFNMLIREIERRQAAHGLGYLYQRPTLAQCRTALAKISVPELVMGREGEKAFNDRCAPYISRRPPKHSGEIVTTDQKNFDVILRDHSWNTGRIWTVNFLDVASDYRLGTAYGPVLSGDMVMDAGAMMLERCKPKIVQFDRGKEFEGKRFTGGHFKISGESFYSDAIGLWERLGIQQMEAIGRNPQTKPVERWHRNLRTFEQLWPTWTGSNTRERPENLGKIEKEIKEKVELFKAGLAPPPPIPTIEQFIQAFEYWCEFVWNAHARGHGRYRAGLTPLEAWNVKAPPGGHAKLSQDEIDYFTAERRFKQIDRGGQVNLTFHGQKVEYLAPELFPHIGERVEIVISRRDLSKVKVIYPVAGGTADCDAYAKDLAQWGEDRATTSLRLRCIATVKRIYKRSVKATDAAGFLLAEAAGLPTAELIQAAQQTKLIDRKQAFGAPAPGPNDHNTISGAEWTMGHFKRSKTSEEIAADFLTEDES